MILAHEEVDPHVHVHPQDDGVGLVDLGATGLVAAVVVVASRTLLKRRTASLRRSQ